MTKLCILDGAKLADLDAIYNALADQLDFPAHFGRNLDALWDVLTTDIPGPIEIEWRDIAAARRLLGADFDRLARLFDDLGMARRDIRIIRI